MVKLDHLTLAVRDYVTARNWYVDQLGLVLEFEIPERGVAALQDSSGFTLFMEQSAEVDGNGNCVLYFQVDNVDETCERLKQRGIAFTVHPGEQFWGYGAELTDLDGYRIRLWDAASMKASR